MERNWYEWLKEQIEEAIKHHPRPSRFAYLHGQVVLAELADLINKEQEVELVDMIPEY